MILFLLQYYGIMRYCKIYLSSPKTYFKKYKNIEKFPSEYKNVVILKISKNDKLKNLPKTIMSILDQTVKIDNIYIDIPDYMEKHIPDNIKNLVNISTTKIYKDDLYFIKCCMNREKESKTNIIILPNNKIYGKDLIEQLISSFIENKNMIISVNNDSIDLDKGCLLNINLLKDDFSYCSDINSYLKNNKIYNINYSQNYNIL